MAKKKKGKGSPDLKEAEFFARRHLDSPPWGTATDQTTGFHEILIRLYRIEEKAMSVGGADIAAPFAEARAICERFLPTPLVKSLRNKHK